MALRQMYSKRDRVQRKQKGTQERLDKFPKTTSLPTEGVAYHLNLRDGSISQSYRWQDDSDGLDLRTPMRLRREARHPLQLLLRSLELRSQDRQYDRYHD